VTFEEQNKKSADFAKLVETQLPALLLFARQWPHDSAEDIAQEAFIRLLNEKEWPENVTAWLFTVVRNQSNNHLRNEKRRKNREIDSAESKTRLFVQNEQNSNFNEETERLIEQLEQLPLENREVIVAKIWGNLTFAQIAAMTDSSTSSVHRIYQAGLALLQKRLEKS